MTQPTLSTIDARLSRIEGRLSTLLLRTLDIMSTQAELQAQMDALVAASAEAKADAARQAGISAQAVALLQSLTAAIADLKSQSGPVSQAQLDALSSQAAAALTDLGVANTVRDEADAGLSGGVAEATPTP